MSQLSVNAITNAAGGNTATINGMTPTAQSLQGFRNRIINGDMRIAQANGTNAVTSGASTVDRWGRDVDTDGASTFQQVTDAPTGFNTSLKFTTTTADASLTGVQRARTYQRIEGLNVSDLAFGTAQASSVTVSFWVKSSLTGTFGGALSNSAFDRSYPFSYTISAANTWEQKTVTIAGDTTGTWLTNNGIGIALNFSLGVASGYQGTAGAWAAAGLLAPTGSVSVIGTLNATWQITGVQLEAGSVATPFERRPYGTELALCQRYFQQFADRHMGLTASASQSYTGGVSLTTTMRATPTLAAGASFAVGTGSAGTPALNQNATAATSSPDFAQIWNSASNWVTATYVEFNGGLTSEL